MTDTAVSLEWETDHDADCKVEIERIYEPGNKTVDWHRWDSAYPEGKRGSVFIEAVTRNDRNGAELKDNPRIHKAQINGLAVGWTVVYRIHTTHVGGANEGMWPTQNPEWHNATTEARLLGSGATSIENPSGPISPTGPTGSAAAPSASASASAAPGKAVPAPRKGGKALPNLPAPGTTTASEPASKLSTTGGNMRASIDALKKKDR